MAGWDDDEWEEEAVKSKPKAPAKADWSDDEWDDAAPAKAKKAESSSEGEFEEPKPAPKGKEFEPPSRKAEPEEQVKIVNKDSMKDLSLNLQKDVETMVTLVAPKLKAAEAKKASAKFLTDTVNALQITLTMAECESFQKLLKASIKQRQSKEKEDVKKKKEEEDKKAKAEKEKKLGKQDVDDEDFFAGMM